MSLYWKVLRIVFVIFSLYLLGDAVYRWDGFRYYASFSEFLPSVALVTILWSILAIFASVIIWLPLRIFEWICLNRRWNVQADHSLIFIGMFALLGAILWIAEKYVFPPVSEPFLNPAAFSVLIFGALFFAWIFRNNAGQWMNIIQGRLTPLVWMFISLTVLSVPVVGYQTLGIQKEKDISREITRPQSAKKNRPNIILVTYDTLRTKDMSVYGYNRPTTPFIKKWAESASLFTGLQAESTYTTPTVASLMTGKRLWTHRTFHYNGSKPEGHYEETLPALLKQNGYYNMAIVQNEAAEVNVLGMRHDFDFAPFSSEYFSHNSLLGQTNKLLYRLFSDKFRIYDWIIKDDFVFNRIMKYFSQTMLDTQSLPYNAFRRFYLNFDNYPVEPFFAWIHLNPPHDPYLSPRPFMGMFDRSSKLRTRQSQAKLVKGRGRITITNENQETVNILKARYDELIRYCDRQFRDFIRKLSSMDLLKNTVIILSADHGESFEHNTLGHGSLNLYEELTNIPFIIKVPGAVDGQVIEDVVEQIDIPATILDFADIKVPSWMEGRSVRPLMRGESLPPEPAFSMALFNNKIGDPISKGTIAVWKGDYKLIHNLNKDNPLLFNLKQDPEELHNLYAKEPDIGRHLLSLIQENLKKEHERMEK